MSLKTQIRQAFPYVYFVLYYLKHPRTFLYKLKNAIGNHFETKGMTEDERYFYIRHKQGFGYKPDFKHPQTFNEKIVHRILYDRQAIYTALADKLKARLYIAELLKDFTQENIATATAISGGGGKPNP